jgi:hypothetical protein
MDPARLQSILASYGSRFTTVEVYPASLRGLIDHRRKPRWIFARFRLNAAKALAEAMPVQTPGSESDGGDRLAIFRYSIAIVGDTKGHSC